MILYNYSDSQPIRELTKSEVAAYLAAIVDNNSHTGAIDGLMFDMPGVTVYAI